MQSHFLQLPKSEAKLYPGYGSCHLAWVTSFAYSSSSDVIFGLSPGVHHLVEMLGIAGNGQNEYGLDYNMDNLVPIFDKPDFKA